MKLIDSPGRRAPLVCALLLTSCLIAACGSSSSSSTSSKAAASTGAGGSGGAGRTALRNCLKAHGVTLPSRPPGGAAGAGGAPGAGGPPPGAGGGPGFFGGGGGRLQNDPKARAALQACGGGNFGAGRRPQLSHQTITKYVTCIRQHGYNMPNPNFSGKGAVFPSSLRSDPKFQAASKTCQSLLFPGRGGASSA